MLNEKWSSSPLFFTKNSCHFVRSFLPFDHIKQHRRSYFKTTRKPEVDGQTVSQISSSAFTLADQPLAESRGLTSNSATSSLQPHANIPLTTTSTNNHRAASEDYEKSNDHLDSQEYLRGQNSRRQDSARDQSDSGSSYPLQVMNEKL